MTPGDRSASTRPATPASFTGSDSPDRPESFALNSATVGAAGTAESRQVGYMAVDRDGAPTYDSRIHDSYEAAEAVARAANAYFFNVEQPVYAAVPASPAAAYFAAEQARSQAWIKRHLDTIDRLRTLIDDHVDTPHTHPANEGEPECPACWAADVLQIIREGRS